MTRSSPESAIPAHRSISLAAICTTAGIVWLAFADLGVAIPRIADELGSSLAALILPASLALIPPEFSGRAEVAAFGIWQAVAWGGLAVGPAIGGLLTDGLGWRWLFWINLPLAVVTLAPGARDHRLPGWGS